MSITNFRERMQSLCLSIARRGVSVWFEVGAGLDLIARNYGEKPKDDDRESAKVWTNSILVHAGNISPKTGELWYKGYQYANHLGYTSMSAASAAFGALPLTGILSLTKHLGDEGSKGRAIELVAYLKECHESEWGRVPVNAWPDWAEAVKHFDGPPETAYKAYLEAQAAKRADELPSKVKDAVASLVDLKGQLEGDLETLSKAMPKGDLIKVRAEHQKSIRQWIAKASVILKDDTEGWDVEALELHLESIEGKNGLSTKGNALRGDVAEFMRQVQLQNPKAPQAEAKAPKSNYVDAKAYQASLDVIKGLQANVQAYRSFAHLALLALGLDASLSNDPVMAAEAVRDIAKSTSPDVSDNLKTALGRKIHTKDFGKFFESLTAELLEQREQRKAS